MHYESVSLWVELQPVVLRPDVDICEALEVGRPVLAPIIVAPEEARHACHTVQR